MEFLWFQPIKYDAESRGGLDEEGFLMTAS